MKKLIFLLLLIIPIACVGQGKHKNGVYIIGPNGTDTAFISADTAYVTIRISDAGSVKGFFMDSASIYIRDDDAGIGMQYYDDYSQGYTDRSPVDLEYAGTHLGYQNLNSSVYGPNASDHGGIITYDSNDHYLGQGQYILTDVVEIGQAAGLVIEDCDTVLFSNTSETRTVTLPAGAKIHAIEVYVATTFDGGGTNLLDIGVTGEGNRYEDNLDLAVGASFPVMTLTNISDRMGANTNITFQYFDSNADAAAGEAYVYVRYTIH